ncbi:alkaline phosphatase D family protein [Rhodoferax sp.]|uniref:alkaline phosphatase D family protein n=1 Tax=Rhodoferax sp. TaxID=50421 RepID=UPI00284E3E44|nr:alkaline phosphatase D family protein [Rhodoferax sp.]MDR3368146.1 alkaline phosphatase D family protein [Rhodoferax sp.]
MSLQAKNRRSFLIQSASMVAAASAVGTGLVACGGSDATPAQFDYGVASGDPLATSVILWTHARIPNSNADVVLTWQVSKTTSFDSIVASGSVTSTAAKDFTNKVDATGLTAGNVYYYRFLDTTNTSSPVGTTRTLPASSVASVKFAVFSCALYAEGYFNAYDAAAKSGAQYAIHLGDYIYEYGAGATEFGNSSTPAGRTPVPATDIVSLADYRARYAQYRSDPNLQAAHAAMPWITVWDDHEFANNAWMDGAENHNSTTQGSWAARKAVAAQAYHEWLPIRTPDVSNLLKIYRRFDFGNIFTLHMLDTRIEGRTQQYDSYGDADGGLTRYATALKSGTDASHPMMSTTQQNWLTSGTAASTATWQILGNQDIMSRFWFPANILQDSATVLADPSNATNMAKVQADITAYLIAKATLAANGSGALTATQTALLDTTTNPLLPYNLDSWDGYPTQREAILQTIKTQGKKLLTLSGDSHNAWFAKVTTLAGEQVGYEFAGTSVSSPGFESVGLGALASSLDGTAVATGNANGSGLGLVNDLGYADTTRRGYLLMTATNSDVKGEYVYVSTVKSQTYVASVGKTVTVMAAGGVTYA